MAAPTVSYPEQTAQQDTPSPLLTREDCLDLYFYMRLAREVEQRAIILYRQGRLVGPLYTGIGNEGVSVGSASALEEEDVIAPMHRDIGAQFVRGFTPADLFAQYMGRVTGPSRGRDGSLHIGNKERRVLAMVSHLGTMIPTAVGVALASRLTGRRFVAMTCIGDGGSSLGDFHEGLNVAAVWKLPFILIVENNQFAYSTPTDRQFTCKNLADRAKGYGIPGFVVDGTDVVAVYDACARAAVRARAGDGPTLIETRTMRLHGHSEHDDASYVPEKMLEEGWRKDPLVRFEQTLRGFGILTDAVQATLGQRISRDIDEAVTAAEQAPLPEPEDALTGVYAE